jgi:hypothetical protein
MAALISESKDLRTLAQNAVPLTEHREGTLSGLLSLYFTAIPNVV